MTQREKFLAGAVGSLVLLWVIWTGTSSYFNTAQRLTNQLERAQEDALDAESQLMLARRSLQRLESLQERSLPADSDVARSTYSAWLVETVEKAGLDLEDVRFTASRKIPKTYESLAFNVDATGSLDSVSKFLYDYHKLACMHQLTKLQLLPLDEAGDSLRMSITTVALVVEGTSRTEGVPSELDERRLRLASVDKYTESLVGRNLFAKYVPPPPPRPPAPPVRKIVQKERPKPPPFDEAKHAYFTGAVGSTDNMQAWITVRTSGKMHYLRAGDELHIGQIDGRVLAVTSDALTVATEEEVWITPLGEPLRTGG